MPKEKSLRGYHFRKEFISAQRSPFRKGGWGKRFWVTKSSFPQGFYCFGKVVHYMMEGGYGRGF
ncbi:MAG: hypothetical protein A2007_03530 [Verrucomicrobia bacterium GWC2_42_7]|nr:MAG: hypothetical protein A2007_03530 [Verrucomicrobia bacterium GWC2_42_7]